MTNLKKKSCFKFLPPIGSSETEARQFKHKLQRGDSCKTYKCQYIENNTNDRPVVDVLSVSCHGKKSASLIFSQKESNGLLELNEPSV